MLHHQIDINPIFKLYFSPYNLYVLEHIYVGVGCLLFNCSNVPYEAVVPVVSLQYFEVANNKSYFNKFF